MPPAEAGGILNFTLERAEVVETVPSRVPVGFAGCAEAIGDHLLGLVRVVRAFFFGAFAIHANRLVAEYGEDSLAFGS